MQVVGKPSYQPATHKLLWIGDKRFLISDKSLKIALRHSKSIDSVLRAFLGFGRHSSRLSLNTLSIGFELVLTEMVVMATLKPKLAWVVHVRLVQIMVFDLGSNERASPPPRSHSTELNCLLGSVGHSLSHMFTIFHDSFTLGWLIKRKWAELMAFGGAFGTDNFLDCHVICPNLFWLLVW